MHDLLEETHLAADRERQSFGVLRNNLVRTLGAVLEELPVRRNAATALHFAGDGLAFYHRWNCANGSGQASGAAALLDGIAGELVRDDVALQLDINAVELGPHHLGNPRHLLLDAGGDL